MTELIGNSDAAQAPDICTVLVSVQLGLIENVKAFLQLGVDVNDADREGNTPLMEAVRHRHPELAHFLVEQGADVNAASNNGVTPLMMAVEIGSLDMTQLLVSQGARINQQSRYGRHALNYAAVLPEEFREREEIMRLLAKNGADFEIKDFRGLTAQEYAYDTDHKDNAKLLAELKYQTHVAARQQRMRQKAHLRPKPGGPA
jgi:ankyrin repeat protein